MTGTHGEEGRATLFLVRLGLAAFLAMNAMTFTWILYGDRLPFLFPIEPEVRPAIGYLIFLFSLPVYLLIGIPFLRSALEEFRRGRPGMDSLIALGTTSAFGYSVYSTFTGSQEIYYDTATMVLVLVTFGRYLEAHARARTSLILKALFAHEAVTARVVSSGGETIVEAKSVRPGSLVRVLPGEEIPVDGTVLEGETAVNESQLTGEGSPVPKRVGDTVLSGSVNFDGVILLRTDRSASDTVIARLATLTAAVREERSPLQLTADRIMVVFVPAVIALAVLSGIAWSVVEGPVEGTLKGLSVLLIACPCAIGIGATLAGAVGYATAAKHGVLAKSVSHLETAGQIDEVIFDKTGTLTEGKLRVTEFHPTDGNPCSRRELLSYAITLEQRSEHPVGKAVVEFGLAERAELGAVESVGVLAGRGIEGIVTLESSTARHVIVARELADNKHSMTRKSTDRTTSYLQIDNTVSGCFAFSDSLRVSAVPAVNQVLAKRIPITILSGDSQEAVEGLLKLLPPVVSLRGGLLPEEKVEYVRARVRSGAHVAMTGDGINDAPALGAATLGISLRSGTDLSRIASDVTILDDDLAKIPWLLDFGRSVRRAIRWNFAWALVYNAIGIGLAVGGMLEPVFAAGAMVVSSLLVIGNSMRLGSAAGPVKVPL
ncbi:MAG: cation-translocating P-type ATPase [Bacteroidota bacterium]